MAEDHDDPDTEKRSMAHPAKAQDGERLAVLEHDVTDIRRDLSRLEAEQVVIKADIGTIKADMAGMRGEMGTVTSTAADARDFAREATATASRIEARMNEPGPLWRLADKLLDRVNAYVLVAWSIPLGLALLALVAVFAFAGGYITEFATNMDGAKGGFRISNQAPKDLATENDDADTELRGPGAGGPGIQPNPNP